MRPCPGRASKSSPCAERQPVCELVVKPNVCFGVGQPSRGTLCRGGKSSIQAQSGSASDGAVGKLAQSSLGTPSRCAQFSAPEPCGRRESVLSATWCVPVAVSFHSLSRVRLLVRTRTVRDRAHPCARERTTPSAWAVTPLANTQSRRSQRDEGAAQGAENVGGESLPKGHVDRGLRGRIMRERAHGCVRWAWRRREGGG